MCCKIFLQSMGLCIRAATTTRPIYIFSCLIMRVAYRQWTNLCCFCSTSFVFPFTFLLLFYQTELQNSITLSMFIDRSTRKMRRIYIVHAKRIIVQFGKFDKMQLTNYRLFHRKGKCYICLWIQFSNTRFINCYFSNHNIF